MAKYVKLKKVWKMLHGLGGCGAEPESWADGWDKAIDIAIGELDKLPVADVQEVKHGEWKEERLASGEIKYTCSKCRQVFQGESLDFNYCPNCGAKMDGKEINDGK